VVLGPSHRDAFTGSRLRHYALDTPLGPIRRRELIGKLSAPPNIGYALGTATSTPRGAVPSCSGAPGVQVVMSSSRARPEAELTLVKTLEAYARKKRLLVVASSDLSHTTVTPRRTSSTRALRSMRRSTPRRSCGHQQRALRGLRILPVLITMDYAEDGRARGELLKQANSATRGRRTSRRYARWRSGTTGAAVADPRRRRRTARPRLDGGAAGSC